CKNKSRVWSPRGHETAAQSLHTHRVWQKSGIDESVPNRQLAISKTGGRTVDRSVCLRFLPRAAVAPSLQIPNGRENDWLRIGVVRNPIAARAACASSGWRTSTGSAEKADPGGGATRPDGIMKSCRARGRTPPFP